MTDIERFNQTIADLESGKVRVAEKVGGEWKVNSWVKEVILSGFRLGKLTDMLEFLIPHYVDEGKYRLVVAIGCTGGKHRSVTLANELYQRMKNKGNYGMTIYHRDINNRSK